MEAASPVPAGETERPVTNPADGTTAGAVHVHTREEVAAAVVRCREAQASWASLSYGQRGRLLKRYRDALLDARDEITDVLCLETGKPRADALGVELLYVCDAIGFWAKQAGRYLSDRVERPHLLRTKRAYSTYKPRGVIGMITPWNFPLVLSVGEAIPALMAGNGVVIKPSSETPLIAELCTRIADQSGLPAGLLS
jgi:acyl-CoA reductase-like NAD-dependent aldehyde dehydrogenase